MLARVGAVMYNTYREAVRARILLGLFGLAVATAAYALVVGQYASKDAARIVSDVGAFSISLYSVAVAILLGATSLYRELELKTVFPILARPLRRPEYVAGKYLGALLTLAVFVVANAGILLHCLQFTTAAQPWLAPLSLTLHVVVIAALALWLPASRTLLPMISAAALALAGVALAASAPADRLVLISASLLTLFEIAIITAVATFFSAFSTPFLTAVLTLGVFVVGRSADTLAKLPPKVFGQALHDLGVVLSHLFPNLMVYVPPRPLLLGESYNLWGYVGLAGAQAAAWSVGLLLCASLLFARRDFL
jgi:Cu-processing system permease protein